MSIQHTFRSPEGMTTRTLTPVMAIKAHCSECTVWNRRETELCSSPNCALYPFRLGDSHTGREMSAEQREAASRRLAAYRSGVGKSSPESTSGPLPLHVESREGRENEISEGNGG